MDKYTELMNRIDTKYESSEVEQTENIISLYDLVCMLQEEMEPLRKLKTGKEFQNKINRDRTVLQRVGLFRRCEVTNKKCTGGYTETEENRSKISMCFEEKGNALGTHIILYKAFDSDQIYFADFCVKDRDFVEKYISDIYGMFAILEQYGTLFPFEKEKNGRQGFSQEFSDGLLNVTVKLDTWGRVTSSIVPCTGNDPENLYTREWYSRETISKHVANMREQILRSIPVEISGLNEVYRKLVEDNLSKKNAMKLGKSIGMAN